MGGNVISYSDSRKPSTIIGLPGTSSGGAYAPGTGPGAAGAFAPGSTAGAGQVGRPVSGQPGISGRFTPGPGGVPSSSGRPGASSTGQIGGAPGI